MFRTQTIRRKLLGLSERFPKENISVLHLQPLKKKPKTDEPNEQTFLQLVTIKQKRFCEGILHWENGGGKKTKKKKKFRKGLEELKRDEE